MLVNFGDVSLQAISRGSGDLVVLLPFLGRSVRDFDPLAEALVGAGFRVVAVNPRGIAESSGPVEGLPLSGYAADVARVIEACGQGPAHVVGYAFGGRVARRLAGDRPDLVRSLSLLSAGGMIPTAVNPLELRFKRLVLRRFSLFELEAGRSPAGVLLGAEGQALRRVVKQSYFSAASSVPSDWYQGWWPAVAAAQLQTMETCPLGEWFAAGTAPILVLQGVNDRFAPLEHARLLREKAGADRVRIVEVPDAAHALLAEQPGRVIEAVTRFLKEQQASADPTPNRVPADPTPNPLPVAGRGLMRDPSPVLQSEPVAKGLRLQDPTVFHAIDGNAEGFKSPGSDGQDAPPLKGEGSGERSPRELSSRSDRYDVAIVGSNLTGSMLAAILARQGARVLLVDPGIHPRFALGESTLMTGSMLLEMLAKRYAVPEIADIASLTALRRKVSSNCGMKRGFGFVYHREGRAPDPRESNQVIGPPVIAEPHLFRQDVDAYLHSIAVRYGVVSRSRIRIVDVKVGTEEVTLETHTGERLQARYLVDASGPDAPLARALELREQPTRLRYQSRSLYTHMVNVKPYDDCVRPRGANGNPGLWHKGTLHHVFDGGALWVIPFDNHKHATNTACSIGLLLDPRRFPATDLPPEQEVREVLARYPGIAAQLEQARPVRDWTATGRQQYSSRQCVGDRWCLLDQAAGCVGDLFSRGVANSAELVNALAVRLIAALKDDDFSAARFAYVERLQQAQLDRDDRLTYGAQVAWADYPLWNAWFRTCTTVMGLGEVWLVDAHLKYLETGDSSLLAGIDASHDPELFVPGYPRFAAFWQSAVAEIDAVAEGRTTHQEAAQRIDALLARADATDFTPPGARIGDPSVHHFNLSPAYMLKTLSWVALTPPRSELKALHVSTMKQLLRGAMAGRMVNAFPAPTAVAMQVDDLKRRLRTALSDVDGA